MTEKIFLIAVFAVAVVIMIVAMPKYVTDDTKKIRGYKKLKSDDINNIPDEELENAVIEWLFSQIDAKGTTEVPLVRAMLPECRYVYSTYIITGEVCSGGFAQCFKHIDSYFFSNAVEGFIAMGAENLAVMLEKACEIAGRHIQENGRNKWSALEENEELSGLSREFVQSEEIATLSETLIKYIRENSECFGE